MPINTALRIFARKCLLNYFYEVPLPIIFREQLNDLDTKSKSTDLSDDSKLSCMHNTVDWLTIEKLLSNSQKSETKFDLKPFLPYLIDPQKSVSFISSSLKQAYKNNVNIRKKKPRIHTMGSIQSQFCTKSSDVDLHISLRDYNNYHQGLDDEHQAAKDILLFTGNLIKNCKLGTNIMYINSIIPVLSFEQQIQQEIQNIPRSILDRFNSNQKISFDKENEMHDETETVLLNRLRQYDITINNSSGVVNSNIFCLIRTIHRFLIPFFVHILKLWAKNKEIIAPHKGNFNSFTFTTLILSFLQEIKLLPSNYKENGYTHLSSTFKENSEITNEYTQLLSLLNNNLNNKNEHNIKSQTIPDTGISSEDQVLFNELTEYHVWKTNSKHKVPLPYSRIPEDVVPNKSIAIELILNELLVKKVNSFDNFKLFCKRIDNLKDGNFINMDNNITSLSVNSENLVYEALIFLIDKFSLYYSKFDFQKGVVSLIQPRKSKISYYKGATIYMNNFIKYKRHHWDTALRYQQIMKLTEIDIPSFLSTTSTLTIDNISSVNSTSNASTIFKFIESIQYERRQRICDFKYYNKSKKNDSLQENVDDEQSYFPSKYDEVPFIVEDCANLVNCARRVSLQRKPFIIDEFKKLNSIITNIRKNSDNIDLFDVIFTPTKKFKNSFDFSSTDKKIIKFD